LSCHASAQSLPHERAAGGVRGYRRMDLLKVLHLQHIGKAPTKGRNRTARRLKISAGGPFSVYFLQLLANAAIAASRVGS
jgi:hypothetical protein